MWQDVKSMDEAVEWVSAAPAPLTRPDGEIEIRQVFEMEEFGAEFTPELKGAGGAPARSDRQSDESS